MSGKIESVWIKCRNCKKMFTQTIYKGKKSNPVCPFCKTVNNSTEAQDKGK
jgi:uncharacterized CHY-type Zn-finger protein